MPETEERERVCACGGGVGLQNQEMIGTFGALSIMRKTLSVTGKSQMGIKLQREGYDFQVKRIISMLAGGKPGGC